MSTAAVEPERPSWRQWRTWTRHNPTLASLDYDRLRGELRHGTDGRKDELLAALVRLAQHNPDVGAVVVACLRPGLRALVARYARGLDGADALADAVAGLWESIAGYRPDDGASFVANRLLQLPKRRLRRAATVQDTWRRHSRLLPEAAGGVARVELSAAAMLRLAVDAGVLTAADASLIHATRVDGHTLRWAARQLGIGYEAAKKRRQRAEGCWAAWWAPRACTSGSCSHPHRPLPEPEYREHRTNSSAPPLPLMARRERRRER